MELLSDCVVVDVAADQHQLILAIAGPVGVIERKSIARQMEHMAVFTFVEPEDSLCPEHLFRHLFVQEVLELAQGERAITLEGHGGESLDVLMVAVAVVMVAMVMTVPMAVVMTVIVPMVVIVSMAVIVFMTVIVVMVAVAMVVVAVAVIQARIVGRGTHLVGFEQSDTEQQG